MTVLIVIIVLGGVPAISALTTYISARILFPDMGLGVPGFGKFYAAAFLITLLYAVIAAIKEAIDA